MGISLFLCSPPLKCLLFLAVTLALANLILLTHLHRNMASMLMPSFFSSHLDVPPPYSCQSWGLSMGNGTRVTHGRSPQTGKKSLYHVAYNMVSSQCIASATGAVTLTTHATPEYLWNLVDLAAAWGGPISVAVFAPADDFRVAASLIDLVRRCSVHVRRKASFHLFHPRAHPPPAGWEQWEPMALLTEQNSTDPPRNCHPPSLNPRLSYFRLRNMSYPVNVARNVARWSASTRYVLVSDIELRPSPGLAQQFLSMLERDVRKEEEVERRRRAMRGAQSGWDKPEPVKKVYVVPIFEVERDQRLPTSKEELLAQYQRKKAVHFHRWVCPHCQKFPGLKDWLKNRGRRNMLQVASVARREYPFHRWEPVYIGTKEDPFYDERLSWEGKQDKMTQMHEMCLLGYIFAILDRAFLVHSPGIKRKPGRASKVDRWREPFEKRNARIYNQIMREMEKKYGRQNTRCRQH